PAAVGQGAERRQIIPGIADPVQDCGRRLAVEHSAGGGGEALLRALGNVGDVGEELTISRLDDRVDHVTAHYHVADVPLDRDGRADGSSVGLKVLDELGVDEHV